MSNDQLNKFNDSADLWSYTNQSSPSVYNQPCSSDYEKLQFSSLSCSLSSKSDFEDSGTEFEVDVKSNSSIDFQDLNKVL